MVSILKMKNSLLFFHRLETLRGQRSKAAFCRDIGVSPPLYQKWAGGSIPGGDKLKLIAKAGGVSVEWLLGMDHSDETAEVREPPAAYSTPADRPADRADASRLDDVVNRLDKMQTQIDTVIRLLGHRLK
jgi:transcriptional regulator with XRE-family HTH domain